MENKKGEGNRGYTSLARNLECVRAENARKKRIDISAIEGRESILK